MDEGQPISYEVLHEGVPVYSSDGQLVGTVASVLSAPEEDIFHGLLIHDEAKTFRFVEASSVASLHERGVDLRLDASAARQLPPARARGAGVPRGPRGADQVEPPDPQDHAPGGLETRALSAGDPRTVAAEFAARIASQEQELLSPLAARSYPARREHPEEDCSLRTPFQRDRDRIVHGKAFRRLTHKTQVFVAPRGDHYRTRLTHTLEVTTISRTVARGLRAERGPRGGDRAGPRPRPPALRAHRRGGSRRLPERALRA